MKYVTEYIGNHVPGKSEHFIHTGSNNGGYIQGVVPEKLGK